MDNIRTLTERDSSLLIQFGDEISPEINARISAVVKLLKNCQIEGVVDLIPSYTALLINYNPLVIHYKQLKKRVEEILKMDVKGDASARKVVEIPVLYGGDAGPDLKNIAEHAGLTEQEVIDIHTSRDYLIYMLGFLPGFCYLGGLDERIHTPRLASPRIRIREGSVGIGGNATGIYPMDSPGGWQLMGRTPVRAYDPNREEPILFRAGDIIRFVPVDVDSYRRITREIEQGDWKNQWDSE